MDTQTILEHQWPYLLSLLPPDLDLDASAKQTRALVRKREITNANKLLRLVFAYALCGMPLRHAAAWAEVVGIASLSNVALLKRLRKSEKWVGQLLGLKLAERAPPPPLSADVPRARLVDATSICQPGATMTTWRLHLGYDLQRHCIDHIELTDIRGGESLTRFTVKEGELVIGDAGYAHRRGLHSVANSGGKFIVRHNYQAVPLKKGFDLFAWLREMPDATAKSVSVYIAADTKNDLPRLPVRLAALRKSEAAAEEARRKIMKIRAKKGKTADPLALEAAGYVCLLTNAPRELFTARQVLSLYRFRWQIELAFKRLKGLIDLGDLPNKDPPMARTYLYAKLLGALLLDDLTDRFLAFSPWGYR
jgi:hypothetical protein